MLRRLCTRPLLNARQHCDYSFYSRATTWNKRLDPSIHQFKIVQIRSYCISLDELPVHNGKLEISPQAFKSWLRSTGQARAEDLMSQKITQFRCNRQTLAAGDLLLLCQKNNLVFNQHIYFSVIMNLCEENHFQLAYEIYNAITHSKQLRVEEEIFIMLSSTAIQANKPIEASRIFIDLCDHNFAPNPIHVYQLFDILLKHDYLNSFRQLVVQVQKYLSPEDVNLDELLQEYAIFKPQQTQAVLMQTQNTKFKPSDKLFVCIAKGFIRQQNCDALNKLTRQLIDQNERVSRELLVTAICGCSTLGQIDEALDYLQIFLERGFTADNSIVTTIISGYIDFNNIPAAIDFVYLARDRYQIFDLIVFETLFNRALTAHTPLAYRLLIDFYPQIVNPASFGRSKIMFERMCESLINYYTQQKQYDSARDLVQSLMKLGYNNQEIVTRLFYSYVVNNDRAPVEFIEAMKASGMGLRVQHYNMLIQKCINSVPIKIDEALQYVKQMTQNGLRCNITTYVLLLGGLVDSGRIGDAIVLCDEIVQEESLPSSYSLSNIIRNATQTLDAKDTKLLLQAFREKFHFVSDQDCLLPLFSKALSNSDVETTLEILSIAKQQRIELSPFYRGAIRLLSVQQLFDEATELVFEHLNSGSTLSHVDSYAPANLIIELVHVGQIERALSLLQRCSEKSTPLHTIYPVMVTYYVKRNNFASCLALADKMQSLGLYPDISVFRAYIKNFPGKNDVNHAIEFTDKLFSLGFTRAACHYHVLLEFCVQHNHLSGVLDILKSMKQYKIAPEYSTFVILVKTAIDKTNSYFADYVVRLLTEDYIVKQLLVRMYGKTLDLIDQVFQFAASVGNYKLSRFCFQKLCDFARSKKPVLPMPYQLIFRKMLLVVCSNCPENIPELVKYCTSISFVPKPTIFRDALQYIVEMWPKSQVKTMIENLMPLGSYLKPTDIDKLPISVAITLIELFKESPLIMPPFIQAVLERCERKLGFNDVVQLHCILYPSFPSHMEWTQFCIACAEVKTFVLSKQFVENFPRFNIDISSFRLQSALFDINTTNKHLVIDLLRHIKPSKIHPLIFRTLVISLADRGTIQPLLFSITSLPLEQLKKLFKLMVSREPSSIPDLNTYLSAILKIIQQVPAKMRNALLNANLKQLEFLANQDSQSALFDYIWQWKQLHHTLPSESMSFKMSEINA